MGIHAAKNCKAVAQRILKKQENISMYLVVTRETGIECMNDSVRSLSIRIQRWWGIVKAMSTSSRENIGEYLWSLLVKQAIIWNGGLAGRKYLHDPKVRVNQII